MDYQRCHRNKLQFLQLRREERTESIGVLRSHKNQVLGCNNGFLSTKQLVNDGKGELRGAPRGFACDHVAVNDDPVLARAPVLEQVRHGWKWRRFLALH